MARSNNGGAAAGTGTRPQQASTEPEIDDSLFPDADALAEAQGLLDDGVEQEAKGRPVGTFQCIVRRAALERSKSSDRLQIAYELEILAGEYAGVKINKYDGMGSPEQSAITIGQLKKLGIELKGRKVTEIPALLLGLVDETIQIQTKQNGDFYNIYFQKRMGAGLTENSGTRAGVGGGRAATSAGAASGPASGGRRF